MKSGSVVILLVMLGTLGSESRAQMERRALPRGE